MAFQFVDRARMSVSGTPGTGTITLASAASGFRTFAAAGVANTSVVPYLIEDGSNWETGHGTYSSTGPTLARTTILSSSNSGAAISATSAAIVSIVPLAADLPPMTTNPSPTSRTGLIATNCRFPDSYGSYKSIMSRTPHVMMENVTSLQVVFANIAGAAEAASGATTSIIASVEFPLGVFTQLQFSATTTGTIPSAGSLTSDALTLTIKAGQQFWIRALVNNTVNLGYCLTNDAVNGNGADAASVVNSGVNRTMGTSPGVNGVGFFPIAIIGTTTKNSVVILGDSRVAPSNDTAILGQPSDIGIYSRSIGQYYAYTALNYPAETTANFIAGHAIRLAICAYATHIVSEYGIVDLIAGGTLITAAQLQTNHATIAAYTNIAGKPYTVATISPQTTSTDNWTTIANQTVTATEAQRVSWNNTIRTALPSWATNYVDANYFNESSENSGKWKADGVTANKYTTDGLHPSTYAIAQSRDHDVVDVGNFGWTQPNFAPGSVSANMLSPGATALSRQLGPQTFTAATLTNPTTTGETLTAGTATVAPLKFTAGTNLTTPAAGAIEYDGASFYAAIAANTRGVVTTEQYVQLTAAYTLTSQTAAQKLFNATTNGAVTLPIGTYDFECMFSLTGMSATSGSFGFALAGTATFTQAWWSTANKVAAAATTGSAQDSFNIAANTTLATANTNTIGYAHIRGTVRVTVAGTIIPQVSLTVASAAIVGANSLFRINPIGASAAATVGNWS